MSDSIIVLPFRHGPFWNFTYLLASAAAGEAAVIDPAWDVDAVVGAAESRRLRITTVLLTHAHSDHAHGTEDLARRTGATVVAHSAELPELRRLYRGAVTEITGHETLQLGGVPLRVLHTPGHTEGSVSILADGQLFTGDTLAVGAVGRAGPAPGALEALWTTVDNIFRALPGDTVVRPGHDAGPSQSASLAAQRASVPALRATTFHDFAAELQRGVGWTAPGKAL